MFNAAAAPPKRAARATAPVSMGRAAPPLELLDPAALDMAPPAAAVSMAEVGVGTPEVNGAMLTLEAPANPSTVEDVLGI